MVWFGVKYGHVSKMFALLLILDIVAVVVIFVFVITVGLLIHGVPFAIQSSIVSRTFFLSLPIIIVNDNVI